MFEDQDLLDDFVVESNEHLTVVESELLELESCGGDVDIELVNRLFRAVHSIKGTAGFFGLQNINQLAHRMEDVLNRMRNSELVPNSHIIDTLLRGCDQLRNMVNDLEHSVGADISAHIEALDAILNDHPIPAGQSVKQGAAETSLPVGTVAPSTTAGSSNGETTSRDASESRDETPAAVTAQRSTQEGNIVGDSPIKPAAGALKKSTPADSSIRVSVGVLDRLMNLAGQLVLSRNQMLQVISSENRNELDAVAAELDQVTGDLQEAIMQTRMQPIGNIFNRFTRVVRDLSGQLGKQCELIISGKEVEVDKSIIEALGDPLTHLLRNAVDHGVEMPDERIAAGKKPVGKIYLNAFHQAGRVQIHIQDDGAGIDPRRLKEKAVAKGIITSEAADQMGDREAVRLIFHPGFSTAAKISEVSGRGVGMDVVRTNIERLGGTVDVQSEIGRGTQLFISLPLTLAIIPSLIVQAGERRFAVPQSNIAELVRVRADEVKTKTGRVKDAEVLRLRGALLPLVRLNAVLSNDVDRPQRNTCEEDRAVKVIVVETGESRYGLVVDSLHDSVEIVVKPLGRRLKRCTCLSGATILGDGNVALILDVSGIANRADLKAVEEEEAQATSESMDTGNVAEERQSLLIFTNHPDEQFAVPMSLVLRIERIRKEQLDSVGGQEILQYRGGTLPLLTLEEHISAQPREDCQRLFVIVFTVQGREMGLFVPYLSDIRHVPIDVDTNTFRETGVIGSQVIDQRVTRIVNLYELVEAAHPEWFEQRPPQSDGPEQVPTILLAEDSGFFRKQVTGFLESEGYDVISCEDGQEALEILVRGEHPIDLVVTDIEMPRMNGFQLCQQIRDDASLAHLPVIALTSLAGEEDRRRGGEVGVDDYQVKMDREQLRQAAARLLLRRNASAPQPALA